MVAKKTLDNKENEFPALYESQWLCKKELNEAREEVSTIPSQNIILEREYIKEKMLILDSLLTLSQHGVGTVVAQITFLVRVVSLNMKGIDLDKSMV